MSENVNNESVEVNNVSDQNVINNNDSTTNNINNDNIEPNNNNTETPSDNTNQDNVVDFVKIDDFEIKLSDLDWDEDLKESLEVKGFDPDQLAREFYSEDGLSEKTLGKLYKKFGKYAVDSTIKSIKLSNELNLTKYRSEESNRETNAQKAWEETLEIVGSEENWNLLNQYISDNYSDQEIDSYNYVMENGDWFQQKLLIEAANIKMINSLNQKNNRTAKINNFDGGNVATPNSYLTQEEYNKLISSGEYSKMSKAEQNNADERRRLGIARGL